ncbi:hypothetical protein [uncultured Dubosiella sp.]|uniref:hypothetical protein n=2 Tax=uncultured Dubosiella sp. TaxID=1937011 RepID=UPI00262BC429|nr:hypothetical protein [uncultured Dubosiella sp.]
MVTTMTQLIKSEWKRISKNFWMAALAAMVIALTAFGIMKLISEHYIQTQIDTIDHIVSECEQDIFDLQQNERLSEDEQQQLDFLNEYLADLRYLKMLYANPKQNAEEIARQRYALNQIMIEKEENETVDQSLFMASIETLQKENNEYDAYWARKITPPVNPVEPNLSYALTTNLDGYTPFMITVLLVVALFLNNTWSEDSEYHTRTLYMALPYSKVVLFASRFITNMMASFGILTIALITLNVISGICFGTGSTLLVELGRRYIDLSHIAGGLILSNMVLIVMYSAFLQLLSIVVRNTVDFKIWASSFLIIDYFVLQANGTFHLRIENVWSFHGILISILLALFTVILGLISEWYFIRQR